MGALPNPKPTEPRRKPVGRAMPLETSGDPQAALRAKTDYDTDSGYSPLYHAVLADLPRLAGTSSACYAFVLVVNMLSYGRPVDRGKPREAWTLPVSVAELASLTHCNVRDIQRQMSEMKDRGMIAVKRAKEGYSISLLYRKWPSLDDYAVWKRKQVVVSIDAAEQDEADEEQQPISKDAVRLTKKPQSIRPGRASRAVKVTCGVTELAFRNDSQVDVEFTAVVQSGRLSVSALSKEKGEGKEKKRQVCREVPAIPASEGSQKGEREANRSRTPSEYHPRASEISSVFDPLLQHSGARLLSIDLRALHQCCVAAGDMPIESLRSYLAASGRSDRSISSPKIVVSIIREARENWASAKLPKPKPKRGTAFDRAMELAEDRIRKDGHL